MAAVVASAALAACTPSLEDYPRELEEAICEWEHGCHVFARERDCLAARAIDRDPRFDYLQQAVAAGSVEYDREAAADCLDAIRGRSCEERYPAQEPACAAVFAGKVGRNGPCMDSGECAGNAICGFDPRCTDQCCVGACRVLAEPGAIGEPCGGSRVCVDEAYCAFDPMTGVSTVCTARVKAGGDCSLGQRCDADSSCDGSVCRAKTVAKVGEPCGDGLVTCAEPARCVYSFEGGQRCQVAPQLGAPCDPQGISCARFDTYCDVNSGLCVLRPGPGAGCPTYECAEYASCEDLSGSGARTCARKALAGEACGYLEDLDRYVECQGDLRCTDGRCALADPEAGPSCPVPGAG